MNQELTKSPEDRHKIQGYADKQLVINLQSVDLSTIYHWDNYQAKSRPQKT